MHVPRRPALAAARGWWRLAVPSGAGSGAAGEQDGIVRVVEVRHLVGQYGHEVGRGGPVPGGVRGVHSQGEVAGRSFRRPCVGGHPSSQLAQLGDRIEQRATYSVGVSAREHLGRALSA